MKALELPAGTGLALAVLVALIVVVVIGERDGGGGGGGEPVAPSLVALSPLDGRSPREPAGGELRVLVELPRPALADRDDLDALSPGRPARLRAARSSARAPRCARRWGRAGWSCATRSRSGAPGTASRRRSTPRTSPRSRASACARSPCAASIPPTSEPVPVAGEPPRARAAPSDQAPIAVLDTGADAGRRLRRARPRRRPGAGERPARARAARDDRHRAGRDRDGGGRARCCPCASRATAGRSRRSTGRPTRCCSASSGRSTPTATAPPTTPCASRWSASTRPTPASATRPRPRRRAARRSSARSSSRPRATRARRGRRTASSARRARRGPRWRSGATEAGAGAARVDVTIGERKLQRAAVLGGEPPKGAPLAGPVDATDAEKLLASGPRLTGHVALVHAGANPVAQATAAAAAGARAVLLAEPRKRVLPLMPAGRVAAPVIGADRRRREGRARREARRGGEVRPREPRSAHAGSGRRRPAPVLLARPGLQRHPQAGPRRSRRGDRAAARRRCGARRRHRGRRRAGRGAGRAARAAAAGRDRGGAARGARPAELARGERRRARSRRAARAAAAHAPRREGQRRALHARRLRPRRPARGRHEPRSRRRAWSSRSSTPTAPCAGA